MLAVHLGRDRGERGRQVTQLLAPGGPVESVAGPLILGGDFNDWPPGFTRRALGPVFTDAAVRHLNLLSVGAYDVVRSRLARVASDHLPVLADYRLQ